MRMARLYIFEIPPQPKERHYGRATKLATRTWEELVAESAREQNDAQGWKTFIGSVSLHIYFCYKEMPKHLPDLSNCVKSLEDALNRIAYEDDNQIHFLQASFNFGAGEDRIEVQCEEM
jgi:Holliday junction resolvase RusA-like endonuclease